MNPDTAAVLIAAASALVVVAVVTEATWLWVTDDGPTDRDVGPVGPRLRTAAAMGAGGVVASQVVHLVDERVSPVIGAVSPQFLSGTWERHPLVGAIVAFVVWDAAGYAYHWVGHRTRIGWASHRVHHTGDSYDMTLAWRQSWLPLPALVVFPPVALWGFDASTLTACAAVSLCWQALVHTSLPIRLPAALTAVVMTPATHRRHHLRSSTGADVSNLGPVLTVWDRLAGTWCAEPVGPDAACGIEGTETMSATAIEWAGWRQLLAQRCPATSTTQRYQDPAPGQGRCRPGQIRTLRERRFPGRRASRA